MSIFIIVLCVLAGLGILGLVYYKCCNRETDNEEEAQITEVQMPDRKKTENNANSVDKNDNEQPPIIQPEQIDIEMDE